MGTRSKLILNSIKANKTIGMYKHWDGYCSETLPLLDEALQFSDIKEVVKSIAKQYGREAREMIEENEVYTKDISLTKKAQLHGDLEYLYIIDVDTKNVDVYANFGSEDELLNQGKYLDYKQELDEGFKSFTHITINGEKTKPVNFLNALNNPKTTSNKYGTTQTSSVIDIIKDNGFKVRQVLKPNYRKVENAAFNKHALRITKPELMGFDDIPEVVFINNNNNRGSAQLLLGIFRMVCMNGMVLGDDIHSQKIRHGSDFLEELNQGLQVAFKNFDKTKELLSVMKSTHLSNTEISSFKEFLKTEVLYPRLSNKNTQRIKIDYRFNPLRIEDHGNDLYTVFNRIQEHVIRKGVKYQRIDLVNDELKLVNSTTREVKAIDANVKLNQELMNKTIQYFGIAV